MTPKSFWAIVIKIMGIYIGYMCLITVWKAITSVLTILPSINILSIYDKKVNYVVYLYVTMASSLLLFIFYVLLFYCFLFKTDWVVKKLKLDKGFENELFKFNIPYSAILKVSLIIVSGVVLIEVAPDLVREVLFYFNISLKKIEFNRNVAYIITDTIKIVIAILLIIYSTRITRYITKNDEKTTAEDIPEQD
jgi:hypothetical protein